jgi:hypothetical protein
MEIHFQTKEESNQKQLEDFLKLSKADRFYSFLRLMYMMKKFPTKKKLEQKKGNFVIVIKSK